MTEPYKTNTQHIQDHLILTDLILHLETIKVQSRNGDSIKPDTLKGIFISREKIEKLIEKKPVESTWFTHGSRDCLKDTDYTTIVKAIKIQEQRISERTKASLEKGINLKLSEIQELFGLSEIEMKIFLICLSPHCYRKYEKLFAYLQDDPNRKYPTIDLILNIFHNTFEGKISCDDYFSPGSSLLKNRLIGFLADSYEKNQPLTSSQLIADNRIYNFILDRQGIEKELELFTELQSPGKKPSPLLLPDETQTKLDNFIKTNRDELDKNNKDYLFYFNGTKGSGKKETAANICRQLTVPLLVVDIRIPVASGKNIEDILCLINRESILLHAAIYFKHADIIYKQDESSILKGNYTLDKKVDYSTLADKFRFTGLQIKNAVAAAYSNSKWKAGENKCVITMQDLYAGCHAQFNKNLGPLAKKVKTNFVLDDIILPPDEKKQLAEIINYVKYRHIVYDEWGFAQKFSTGKGLNVLFSGPPGVGKTMAAEIMVHELGLDLYKIDLSVVVSKYIGETEKNLNTIFNESSNVILFFDEADALFTKRTEVKDAHDRYANIETGFLLQKIEEYEEGCVILATNMRDNVDDAFLRRMHFTVTFPFPDKEYRLQIWEHIFPEKLPLGKDIDF
jgi:hypothetical protein